MSLAAVFDREMQDTFSFFAIATDNGVSVMRTGEVVVNVTILDENDVTPAFSENVYNVSWYENTTVGAVLLTIDAFDPDLGRNGTLAYSILPSNDSSFFSINSTSGDIFLDRQFDREMQDWFRFYVTTHDFGSPSLTGTAAVQIEVLDNNDEVPVINSSQYLAVLPENTPVGSTIIYIGASDLDINQNARLQFSLSQDFNGTFTIAAEAGTLTLTKSLDYEFFQNYSFSVIVQDSGENPLQTSSVVSVDVVDLNDNPPVLTLASTPFQFQRILFSILQSLKSQQLIPTPPLIVNCDTPSWLATLERNLLWVKLLELFLLQGTSTGKSFHSIPSVYKWLMVVSHSLKPQLNLKYRFQM